MAQSLMGVSQRLLWGRPSGALYATPEGRLVQLRRRGARCRFYDNDSGEQVGPEQPHVAAAIAYAMTRGWRS